MMDQTSRVVLWNALTFSALLGTSACTFDTSNKIGPREDDASIADANDTDAPGVIDADVRIDASENPDASDVDNADAGGFDAAVGPDCTFRIDAINQLCESGGPIEALNFLSGSVDMIDTDNDSRCRTLDMGGGRGDACLLLATDVLIAAAITVRAHGSRPLVIAATGTISILGTVDASSHIAGLAGAGAEANVGSECAPSSSPGQNNEGAGGAAGGSFAGLGGDGGTGDLDDSGSDGTGAAGIAGPTAGVEPQFAFPHGGCPGDTGADSGLGFGGIGGASGGTVGFFASSFTLASGGSISVTGSGGGGGASLAGGGGGGSGGLLLIEAAAIDIAGKLAAHGGGGGGGGGDNGAAGQTGSDGTVSSTAAMGGAGATGLGQDGGEGGTGSGGDPSLLNGSSGTSANGGGGGGGGSAGFIVLRGVVMGANSSWPPATKCTFTGASCTN